MTFYITRNGERQGPFSAEEVQARVAAGVVQEGDWVWHEGLPDWIPLRQMPGLLPGGAGAPGGSHGSPPAGFERPVLVWIICLFYFACSPLALLCIAIMPMLRSFVLTSATVPEGQRAYFESLNAFDYLLMATGSIITLVAAILLFLLRRSAFWAFLASFVFGVLATLYNMAFKHWLDALSATSLVSTLFGWAVILAILGYVWKLYLKGTLR